VSLFDASPAARAADKTRPLADRMRPESLEEFVGQEHILAPGKPLRMQIEKDELTSLILWDRRAAARPRWRRSSRA